VVQVGGGKQECGRWNGLILSKSEAPVEIKKEHVEDVEAKATYKNAPENSQKSQIESGMDISALKHHNIQLEKKLGAG